MIAQPLNQSTRGLGDALLNPILFVVAVILTGGLWLLVWLVRKSPRLIPPLAIVAAILVYLGPTLATWLLLGSLGLCAAWRFAHRSSFTRFAGLPVRSSWRRTFVYGIEWRNAMLGAGLYRPHKDQKVIPKLLRVKTTPYADWVLVQPVHGQCAEDYRRWSQELAYSFRALGCKVREERRSRLWLIFKTGEPLANEIPALPIPDQVDLDNVHIGTTEDGEPWTVSLFAKGGAFHLLIAGAIGAGKSSIVWSIIRGIAPMIRDGLVHIYALDPKGGVELSHGRGLFEGYADNSEDPEAMVKLIEHVVALMQDRMRRFRDAEGIVRKLVISVREPLIVLIIDEIAFLTTYEPNDELRARFKRALNLILTQGRAVGVGALVCIQDPRVETLPARQHFSERYLLRFLEEGMIDKVLGGGAKAAGANCHQIPKSMPGVGYAIQDGGKGDVFGFRAAHTKNEHIAVTAMQYGPRSTPAGRLRKALESPAQLPADRPVSLTKNGHVPDVELEKA